MTDAKAKEAPIREAMADQAENVQEPTPFKELLEKPASSGITADYLIANPHVMDSVDRAAHMMATAKHMMPAHLRNSPGDCMAVFMQASQWHMNPFALAQKTFIVSGQLGYEAQAIKAAVDSSRQLKGRLDFNWFGPWDQLLGKLEWKQSRKEGGGKYPVPMWTPDDEANCGVICYGQLRGEAVPRELKIMMSQAHPRNSTLWTTDPRQQIAYLAAKRWARLHLPEVLMGIYDPEELGSIVEEAEEQPAAIRMPKKTAQAEKKEEANRKAQDKHYFEGIKTAMEDATDLETLHRISKDSKGKIAPPFTAEATRIYKERKAALSTPAQSKDEPDIDAGQPEAAPQSKETEEKPAGKDDFFDQ